MWQVVQIRTQFKGRAKTLAGGLDCKERKVKSDS